MKCLWYSGVGVQQWCWGRPGSWGMERSYGIWEEGRLKEMGLLNTYLTLVENLGLDLKNRSRVRDLVSTSHFEDAGIH